MVLYQHHADNRNRGPFECGAIACNFGTNPRRDCETARQYESLDRHHAAVCNGLFGVSGACSVDPVDSSVPPARRGHALPRLMQVYSRTDPAAVEPLRAVCLHSL